MNTFHLSFIVPDKEKTKVFYRDVLGCEVGRDNSSWFDIIFFGHQLTIHQESDTMKSQSIDHFGPILSREDWSNCLKACTSSNVNFVGQPVVTNQDQEDESGKFLIQDPAGNILEFKYYLNFNKTVG